MPQMRTDPIRVSEDKWALDGCPDDGPAMAVDRAGVVHVAWPTVVDRLASSGVEGPEPYKGIFYSSSTDGKSFAPRVRVTPEGRNAAHPQLVAHDGGVTLLWDEVIDGTRRVFSAGRSGSNGSFTPVALSDVGTPASYPAAVVSGDGIVAAWTAGQSNTSTIVIRRLPIR